MNFRLPSLPRRGGLQAGVVLVRGEGSTWNNIEDINSPPYQGGVAFRPGWFLSVATNQQGTIFSIGDVERTTPRLKPHPSFVRRGV